MQADIDAARRGDLRAFNRLVAAHQDQLYALTWRALGDQQAAIEASQAAVAQAARNLKHSGNSEFRLWLLHWAARTCLERMRDSATTRPAPSAGKNSAPEPGLQGGLHSLPADLRLPIILVDVIGLDYTEAGIALGAPRELVRRLVAEARWRLVPTGRALRCASP